MTPEEKARQEIDRLLVVAGWVVQDYDQLNLGATSGVAVRESLLNQALRIIFSSSIVRQWEP